MAFIEWINERVLFIDMHTNWYQWYCGHFSGVVNEWCFNCHLDTNHINCGRDQGILTSNCGIMNFVAWKNKFPIFCFHKGTGIIYHEEQSLGHQKHTMLDNVYFDIGSLQRHQGQPPSPHREWKPRQVLATVQGYTRFWASAWLLSSGGHRGGTRDWEQLGRCYHGARLDPWRLEELCFLF